MKVHMAFVDVPWTYCGFYLGYGGLNTGDWDRVTCKLCLRKRAEQGPRGK